MRTIEYDGYNLILNMYRYRNDVLAILAECEEDGYVEPFDDITTNIPDGISRDNFTYINEQYCELIEKNHLGTYTGITTPSGFNLYKLYNIDLDALREVVRENEYDN